MTLAQVQSSMLGAKVSFIPASKGREVFAFEPRRRNSSSSFGLDNSLTFRLQY